ncbi:hypothetical protein DPMN_104788 [Dreissena polymorpha]|uniref:Uncharacterized protein n=1 Tax=Dreissena polymorpha TaxID=45954 RepID=A0A9D4H8E3_DREPO|nr:hypothetical protein DPMN_104788 [Dreissena polymorpha]
MSRAQSVVIVCSQTPSFMLAAMGNVESTICCNRLQSDTIVHVGSDGNYREHTLL